MADYPDMTDSAANASATAGQVAATGVPLLLKQAKLASGTNTSIGPGGTVTLNGGTQLSVNQPTLDMFFSLNYSPSNGVLPYATVQIAWFDSTGTNQIWYDAITIIIGDKSNPFTSQLRIPVRGFSFNVTLSNLDSSAINATWEIEATSFPVADIDTRWAIPTPGVNPPTLTFPSGLYPDSKTIAAHVNTALTHGQMDTIILPPAPGRVWFNMWEQGVAAANMSVRLDATPPTYYTGTSSAAFLVDDVMVAGNPVKYSQLINGSLGPIRARISNNDGALAANYVFTMTRE